VLLIVVPAIAVLLALVQVMVSGLPDVSPVQAACAAFGTSSVAPITISAPPANDDPRSKPLRDFAGFRNSRVPLTRRPTRIAPRFFAVAM
jgi:hypothetical protein